MTIILCVVVEISFFPKVSMQYKLIQKLKTRSHKWTQHIYIVHIILIYYEQFLNNNFDYIFSSYING